MICCQLITCILISSTGLKQDTEHPAASPPTNISHIVGFSASTATRLTPALYAEKATALTRATLPSGKSIPLNKDFAPSFATIVFMQFSTPEYCEVVCNLTFTVSNGCAVMTLSAPPMPPATNSLPSIIFPNGYCRSCSSVVVRDPFTVKI
ncbi:unnamed protein product [Oikopleura dioica]|uniref:ZP domain-containing protein n=1 Tax=Oikopleura dioica TaxID=34765 RepID=E4Z0P9_OIKDI|nr:unnamed protein product [Oikopleura dioica]